MVKEGGEGYAFDNIDENSKVWLCCEFGPVLHLRNTAYDIPRDIDLTYRNFGRMFDDRIRNFQDHRLLLEGSVQTCVSV